MGEQIDFRWRYQPRKEIDIKLMEYIQSNPIRAKSEIILVAIRSFWLPHAITTNSGDNKQIQSIARSCIQVLKRQAQEIEELAGLEESYGIVTTHPGTNKQTLGILPNISGKLVGDHSENCVYDDGGLSNFL
jgi:hypothetical protein